MSNILGSLFVELRADTAAFVEGMSKASYAAKQAGHDIEHAFDSIGGVFETALAPFGEFGSVIGETLSKIGHLAGGASSELAGMGGAMAIVGASAGAAAGAVLAADAAAIGLTVHTAEAASRLFTLSQATGVSVETLSGLSFVAKQAGVDSETMTKGLERLSRTLYASATNGKGSIQAFDQLHIATKDASGGVRDVGEVFADVADRFSKMSDGAAKTALAMQLFGRGGAALIPILNEGRQGIEEFLKTAEALGVVLDSHTAQAADKFVQALNTIEAAGTGLSYKLMRELLPALEAMADKFIEALKNPESGLNDFIKGLAKVVEWTLVVGDTFYDVFYQIGTFFQFLQDEAEANGRGIHNSLMAAVHLDFSGARREAVAGEKEMGDIFDRFAADSKKTWTDLSNFKQTATGPEAPWTLPPKRGGYTPDQPIPTKNIVEDTIAKLIAQTAMEAALATSISDVTATTIQNTAAAEAAKTIAELEVKAKREKLTVTEAEKKQIQELTLLQLSYKAAFEDNKGIEQFIQKTQEQTKQTELLAKATGSHQAAAIEAAKEAEKLSPYDKQLNDLALLAEALQAAGRSDKELKPLIDAYEQLGVKREMAAKAIHADAIAKEKEALEEVTYQVSQETQKQEGLTAAILKGAAAVRAFNVEQKTQDFAQKNPLVDPGKYRAALQEQSDAQLRMSAAQHVASSQAFQDIQDKIAALELLRADEIANGQDTLATDLLIHQERIAAIEEEQKYYFDAQNAELLGNAKLYESQRGLIEQWDKAAEKVGTLAQRWQAFGNQIVLAGDNFGEKVFASMNKAIDDLSTKLAQFVTTGKANFKEIAKSLEESVAKAGFQKLFATATQGIGGLFGKSFAKADGSSSNPFYVIPTGPGGLGGGLFGNTGHGGADIPFSGHGTTFGGDDSGDSSQLFSGLTSIFSKLASGFTSIFSKIGSLFGGLGFLAGGGDVTPGNAYVVGEKHPEFFVPNTPGHVTPTLGQKSTTVHFHVHGVTDFDSFKRSQSQIMGDLHRSMAMAHGRTY